MRRKPVIGIPYADMAVRDAEMRIRTYVTRKYYGALQRAGATVLLLPAVCHPRVAFPAEPAEMDIADYLELIDGLLLAGGEDVDPCFQNEDPHPRLGVVNPYRDRFELEITREAFARGLPIMGICRGIQVMAMALGGSIHQDIQDMAGVQHEQKAPRWAPSHRVSVAADSLLSKWIGETEIAVNSFHHQAVREVPEGFRVTATTADGIIEAMEAMEAMDANSGKIAFGVQWHPEELASSDDASAALFAAFVARCRPP